MLLPTAAGACILAVMEGGIRTAGHDEIMKRRWPVARKIGAHSRLHRLVKVDRRTKEGRLLDAVRLELLEHIGSRPTPLQRLLIQRACVLSLRLAQIDRKIFEEREFSVIDNNQAIAWQNALTRCLVALGVRPDVAQDDDLAAVLVEMGHG